MFSILITTLLLLTVKNGSIGLDTDDTLSISNIINGKFHYTKLPQYFSGRTTVIFNVTEPTY